MAADAVEHGELGGQPGSPPPAAGGRPGGLLGHMVRGGLGLVASLLGRSEAQLAEPAEPPRGQPSAAAEAAAAEAEAEAPRAGRRRRQLKWLPQEDAELRRLIEAHGIGEWQLLCEEGRAVFRGRGPEDLSDRWRALCGKRASARR